MSKNYKFTCTNKLYLTSSYHIFMYFVLLLFLFHLYIIVTFLFDSPFNINYSFFSPLRMYVSAAVFAHHANKKINTETLTGLLKSIGAKPEQKEAQEVAEKITAKPFDELIAEGRAKMTSLSVSTQTVATDMPKEKEAAPAPAEVEEDEPIAFDLFD